MCCVGFTEMGLDIFFHSFVGLPCKEFGKEKLDTRELGIGMKRREMNFADVATDRYIAREIKRWCLCELGVLRYSILRYFGFCFFFFWV